MTKRAERRRMKLKRHQTSTPDSNVDEIHKKEPVIKNPYLRWYDTHYKKLIIFPLALLLIAFISIGLHMAQHDGSFLKKDITLKGGISITVPSDTAIDPDALRDHLVAQDYLVSVRNLLSAGRAIGFIVEADIDLNDEEAIDQLIANIDSFHPVPDGEYSIEGTGASIGEAFFQQALIALIFSFIIMAIIVFITFRSFVPSITVIVASISDIVVTLAIVNILDFHLSAAGLAAFLMLIGYSVDTNILLTNRLFKRTAGTSLERLGGAFRTGIIMSATTIVALSVGLFFASSEVIRQVMTILLIGILVDQINTWLQNAGILRWYIDSRDKPKGVKL